MLDLKAYKSDKQKHTDPRQPVPTSSPPWPHSAEMFQEKHRQIGKFIEL